MYLKIKRYANCNKIIYAITPPSSLRNIGDQAQVIAIKKWFQDYFENYEVLEFDKNDVYACIQSMKKITNNDDLIFLHSGGNLGDRGLWSENARRLVIQNFPDNKIVSLPQTIFFSNTAKGKKELETSKKIYNQHNDLTIIGRDSYSFELAKKYFPNCKTLVCPDFVLYLNSFYNTTSDVPRENILLCLRNDSESIINEEIRSQIKKHMTNFGELYTEYDTTLNHNISRENREKEFISALSLFRKHKFTITDRFHGVIFSVITKTPCIVLKTVDHKLTDSIKWFKNLNYVFYVEDLKQLPKAMEDASSIQYFNTEEWDESYFSQLKDKILN